MSTEPHPATELEALTHGLRRALRRRAALGVRRLARAPEPAASAPIPPATPPPPQTTVEPPAHRPPLDDTGPAERDREHRFAPAATAAAPTPPAVAPPPVAAPLAATAAPLPAGAPALPPPPEPDEALDSEAIAARAAAVREVAASCPDLEALERAVSGCTACGLCHTRTRTVFADGGGAQGVLFVGEAPGFHEDQQGVPFVGPAGGLLNDIIEKGMKLTRADVMIANVLKCRPPGNRDPLPSEKAICTGWLDRQMELIDARVVVPLGRHAADHILGCDETLGRLRGQVHDQGGRKVVPTYHPAYLLRSPEMKKACWQDIQLAMRELGLEPPSRKGR